MYLTFDQCVAALKMLEQGRTAQSVADHLVVVEHKFRSILIDSEGVYQIWLSSHGNDYNFLSTTAHSQQQTIALSLANVTEEGEYCV